MKELKFAIVSAALLMSTVVGAQTSAPAVAATQTPAATPRYTTESTDIGTLLDDPESKDILTKHLPDLVKNEQIEMARGMTLKAVQQYAGDMVTDAKLAAIDADLAKLPPKK